MNLGHQLQRLLRPKRRMVSFGQHSTGVQFEPGSHTGPIPAESEIYVSHPHGVGGTTSAGRTGRTRLPLPVQSSGQRAAHR